MRKTGAKTTMTTTKVQKSRKRERVNVLLGVSGSVAAIKFREVCRFRRLVERAAAEDGVDVSVRAVFTESARRFVNDDEARVAMAELGEAACGIYYDSDEWAAWKQKGDPVTHVDLAKWADVLLVAPLSANTLGKFANGLCDNLLTCIFRAWDFTDETKQVLMAPAMNTAMWESPFTVDHKQKIQGILQTQVDWIPVTWKKLACGDVGYGAMAEPDDIQKRLFAAIHTVCRERANSKKP